MMTYSRAATQVTYGNAMLSDSVYESLDRIERREIANAAPPGVFDYTFDLTGRRTGMTEPGGRTVAYQYEAAGDGALHSPTNIICVD